MGSYQSHWTTTAPDFPASPATIHRHTCHRVSARLGRVIPAQATASCHDATVSTATSIIASQRHRASSTIYLHHISPAGLSNTRFLLLSTHSIRLNPFLTDSTTTASWRSIHRARLHPTRIRATQICGTHSARLSWPAEFLRLRLSTWPVETSPHLRV